MIGLLRSHNPGRGPLTFFQKMVNVSLCATKWKIYKPCLSGQISAQAWQLRFMWTFKQHTQHSISLTNQYHHFGSFSSLTSPCACSFLISLSMGELIREDGIISSSRESDMPCSLPSPHFWHMNKKCSLFVLLHCGISLKEYTTQGSHGDAGRQVGAGNRLLAIAYSSQTP